MQSLQNLTPVRPIRPECPFCGISHAGGHSCPSPEEIAAACRALQATWSASERALRRRVDVDALTRDGEDALSI